MFKKIRQPKIKSITMGISGDFIFTFGLGRDGKVYSWNAQTTSWVIHQAIMPIPEQGQADAS